MNTVVESGMAFLIMIFVIIAIPLTITIEVMALQNSVQKDENFTSARAENATKIIESVAEPYLVPYINDISTDETPFQSQLK